MPQIMESPPAGDRRASETIDHAPQLIDAEDTPPTTENQMPEVPACLDRRTAKPSWRDVLKVHPAADLFPMMTEAELKVLGADIREHGLTSPIVIWSERGQEPHYLLDGRNRLDAMEALGLRILDDDGGFADEIGQRPDDLYPSYSRVVRHVSAWVCDRRWHDPTKSPIDQEERWVRDVDPYEYVLSANIHRRHLTADQKRELIAKLLKATPQKSNRQIAETVKTSHHTVEDVRVDLQATGQIAQLSKTIGKDGKARTTKPARRAYVSRQERRERERATWAENRQKAAGLVPDNIPADTPTKPSQSLRDILPEMPPPPPDSKAFAVHVAASKDALNDLTDQLLWALRGEPVEIQMAHIWKVIRGLGLEIPDLIEHGDREQARS